MSPILRDLLVNVGGGMLRETLRDAADEFERFHWGNRPKRKPKRIALPETGGALVEIGELVGVIYRTAKSGAKTDDWIHEFGEEGGRLPKLAYDPHSHDLFILGGDYDVLPDGIVD